MAILTYYNGVFGDAETMTVPLLNRTVYFGDGCYDAAFTIGNGILDLEDHVERFFNSMKYIRIEPDFTREELTELLKECLKKSGAAFGLLYWQIDRGTAPRNHCFPTGDVKPDLLISVYPKKGYADMMTPGSAITFEDKRYLYCNVKTLNLLPNVLANQAAVDAGVTESFFVRPGGIVTEGSHTNVLILKDGVLRTHETGEYILPGITRKHVIICAKELGIPVEEKAFTVDELMEADEIFISGSSTLTHRIGSVNGKPAGLKDEALYRKLTDAYMAHIKESAR